MERHRAPRRGKGPAAVVPASRRRTASGRLARAGRKCGNVAGVGQIQPHRGHKRTAPARCGRPGIGSRVRATSLKTGVRTFSQYTRVSFLNALWPICRPRPLTRRLPCAGRTALRRHRPGCTKKWLGACRSGLTGSPVNPKVGCIGSHSMVACRRMGCCASAIPARPAPWWRRTKRARAMSNGP